MSRSLWVEVRLRVERRAAELGRTVKSLLQEAGVSPDLLYRPRISSPKVDTLTKIAGAAGMSLGEILGIEIPNLENGQAMPPDLVAYAIKLAQLKLPNEPADSDLFIDAVSIALNILILHRRRSREIDKTLAQTLEIVIDQMAERRRSSVESPPPDRATAPDECEPPDRNPLLKRRPRTT